MVVIAGLASAGAAMPAPLPRGGSSGFVVPQPSGAAEAPREVRRTGMADAISTSMLLALQERGTREGTEEEARRHGRRLLDELARLQRALLSGASAVSLDSLEALTRVEPGDVDPALAGALSSIRLRARIELARRAAGRAAV